MEKKVYGLRINKTLGAVMPPLQNAEVGLLIQSLITEGCRDPLVVWNETVVDGYNRYRIFDSSDEYNYSVKIIERNAS